MRPPLACPQEHFDIVASEYVYLPWRHSQEAAAAAAEAAAEAATQRTPAVPQAATAAAAEAAEAAWLADQVGGYFTDKVLRLVREIQRLLDGPASSSTPGGGGAFPRRAGSHLSTAQLGSPALAFARSLMHVLALDAVQEAPVAELRRNLLRLLRVREFSPEAAFVDPCRTFILRDCVCTYCNERRDLDLCRDEALQRGDWACPVPGCGHEMDRSAVEGALIREVRRLGLGYVLQDLYCLRDRKVKVGHLADKCACGGRFRCRAPPEAQAAQLGVFASIAEHHGFELLADIVEWTQSS